MQTEVFRNQCLHLVNNGPLTDFVATCLLTMDEAEFVHALNIVRPPLPDPFKNAAQNKFRDMAL